MNKVSCLFLFLLIFSLQAFSQKEAYNWYFGSKAALNFSSGVPVSLTNSAMVALKGCTSLSDSAGNLLFYSNGTTVWNKNHQQMLNGYGLLSDPLATQAALGLKAPGSNNLYYLFTVGSNASSPPILGAYYTLIDMSLEGGLGSVIPWQKNIPLQGADSAMEVFTAIACAQQDAFWIFVRNYTAINKILAYKVDVNGVHQTPVISNCSYNQSFTSQAGTVKASSDGRFMIYGPSAWVYSIPVTELYSLNSNTGQVTSIFNFNSGGINWGAEFSANSEFLYLATESPASDSSRIVQYNMSSLSNATAFQNSRTVINSIQGAPKYWQCQLAPDGKIYICQYDFSGSFYKYLSVINDPSKPGLLSNFQSKAVSLVSGNCVMGLPTFVQSYFARFTWKGECMNQITQFTSNFLPVPDSISWNFDDPSTGNNNQSSILNPVHIFSDSGSYHVKATAFFDNGHQEISIRIVRISPQPEVNLGPDFAICPNQTVTLDAGQGFTSYLWNTGQQSQTIQVSDTGQYWVYVSNSSSCSGSDTIQLYSHPAPILDESELMISPTTCGGSTGAITGLSVNGIIPYDIQWKDGNSNLIGDSIDIYHLPVDNYTLYIHDVNGCYWPSGNYTINDVGDVLIDSVLYSNTHCGKTNGMITIIATTGLTTMLKYSIDNGINYSLNTGMFTNLPPGNYQVKVMVTDITQPCQKVYDYNPVIIYNIAGPEISSVVTHFESGSLSDGSITVYATGSSDSLFYSVGGIIQVNNGVFTNLPAGTYNCRVYDSYGCDTSFVAVVNNLATTRLQAIAGNVSTCLGNVAILPLLTNNFSHISSFTTLLKYNKSLINCQNYFLNPNPELADSLQIFLYPSLGELSLKWLGNKPANLPNNSTLLELAFASVDAGTDSVKWDISPGICTFIDSLGNTVAPEFKQGEVRVYSIPEGTIFAPESVCAGSDLSLIANHTPGSGNGPISYQWSGPNGFTDTNPVTFLSKATQANAGDYLLNLADTNHCQGQASIRLNVIPLPVADFSNDTIYFEQETEIQAKPGYDHYSWSTGDSTSSITIFAEGWYKVTIVTAEGCTTMDSLLALYSFVPLKMPNAFSPNNDGKNDLFRPVTIPEKVKSFTMDIYSRWGQLVFTTNDLETGWDGHFGFAQGDKEAPMGVYTYIISYSNATGETRKKTGVVTLVR